MTTPLTQALQPILSRVRTDATAVRQSDGIVRWTDQPLTEARLLAHLTDGAARGCCPIKAGQSTVMLGLFDLDSHKGEVSWSEMSAVADRLCGVLEAHDLMPIAFRSGGGNGMHIYLIWDQVQDAYSVRRAMTEAVEAIGYKSGTGGLGRKQIEVFPKQNSVAADKFGNMFVLPLSRASVPLSPAFEPLPRDAVLTLAWPVSAPVPGAEAPVKIHQSSDHTPLELQQLESALAAIPQESDPLTYDDWFRVVCAIHHETEGGDDGLALVHAFSERCSKHDADYLDNRVWPYLHNNREQVITGASVLHMARTHGWNGCGPDDFDVVEEEPDPPGAVIKKPKFTPVHAAQFAEERATSWLIKGVLPAALGAPVLAVMYGASGSGKSFQATDMAIAIARGIPWRGHRVTKGRVVYVCAEGAGGYRKRLKAYAKHHNIALEDIDVFVIAAAPNLLEADDVSALIRAIHPLGPVVLVVIDTLAQATAGGNENSGEDMGRAIGHCRTISEVLNCTVLLVHHSGKDDTKGARGHSSLKAAADTEFEVVRTEERRAMRLSKQKDGEDSLDMGFELKVINLGEDPDGDPVTSCVVEHNEDTVAAVRAAKEDKTGPVERTMLEVLDTSSGLTDCPEMPTEDLISQTAGRLEWDGKRDQRKTRAKRALKRLLNGVLTERDAKIKRAG